MIANPGHPESTMPHTMIPAFGALAIPIAILLTWTGIGLYAAWQTWHGRDYTYPGIGIRIP
jgi:hypothetical protein